MRLLRTYIVLVLLTLLSSCAATLPPQQIDTTLITRNQFVQKYGIIDNSEVNNYLAQLIRTLSNAEQRYCSECRPAANPRCEVIASNALFALTISAQNILISRGILLSVKNEAELAFIFAHEISHTRFSHLALLRDRATDEETLRNAEITADRHALAILILAGYDPWAGIGILSRLSLHLKGSEKELLARTARIQETLLMTGWTPPGVRSTREFAKMQALLKATTNSQS